MTIPSSVPPRGSHHFPAIRPTAQATPPPPTGKRSTQTAMSHTRRRPSRRRCSVRSFRCSSSSLRDSLGSSRWEEELGFGVVGGMTIDNGRRKLWIVMWMKAGDLWPSAFTRHIKSPCTRRRR